MTGKQLFLFENNTGNYTSMKVWQFFMNAKKRKNVKELNAFLEQPKAEKFKLSKRKCDKTEKKLKKKFLWLINMCQSNTYKYSFVHAIELNNPD